MSTEVFVLTKHSKCDPVRSLAGDIYEIPPRRLSNWSHLRSAELRLELSHFSGNFPRMTVYLSNENYTRVCRIVVE
jgi:hypothetical protein